VVTDGQGDEAQTHLLAFGLRVRDLRRACRLSQEELAHEAGHHRTVIGFIERGEREIGITKVWPLAAALGVRPSALFEGD
jgi:transcriptional regulator with XRE-family HTH domain